MKVSSSRDIARYTELGWWGTTTLYDVFREAAARDPNATALIDPPDRAAFTDGEPRRLAWHEVQDKVDRLASFFLRLGLRRDDRLVVQLPTVHEFLITYLACFRLGTIAVPVPTQYREHELDFIIEHTGARAFLSMCRIGKGDHARIAMSAQKRHATLEHVLLFGAQVPRGAVALDCVMEPAPDPAALAEADAGSLVDANDIATILWTSGTESRPKAVPRTHNQWLASRRLMSDAAQLESGCRILSPRMLNTMGGVSGSVVTWLDRAATMALHQPLKVDIMLRQIEDERIEFTSGPPALLHELLKYPDRMAALGASSLRYISSGSAALPGSLIKTFQSRFGIEILNFYGSTEGASLAATALDMPDAELRGKYFMRYGVPQCRSPLTSARHVETRLIDPGTGRVIDEPGIPGELHTRGPQVFSQYFHMPEATARTLDADGFYRTGDLFRIAGDQGQYLEFVGRTKDIIVRGGVNISAQEIESLLIEHPAVASVAVVGYPDAKLGEKVCAAIVPKAGETPGLEEMCQYLRDSCQVAVYKLPQRLITLSELPRNAAGKVLKSTLRDMLSREDSSVQTSA